MEWLEGELLRTLYYGAINILNGGLYHKPISDDIIRSKEKFTALLSPSEKNESSVQHIIDILPDHFGLGTDSSTQKRLVNIICNSHRNEEICTTETFPDPFCDVTEIAISTKDYPGLFATLTGALSSSGVHIYDARIFTSKDKWVIDQFRIQDVSCKAITDRSHLSRIKSNIHDAVSTRKTDFEKNKNISHPICSRSEDVFDISTAITFDNKISSAYTIIEIETLNRPFLLYDISCIFKDMHITIFSAHINSFGEKAIDVFYVKDEFGFKITDMNFIKKIKKRIHSICDRQV